MPCTMLFDSCPSVHHRKLTVRAVGLSNTALRTRTPPVCFARFWVNCFIPASIILELIQPQESRLSRGPPGAPHHRC